MNYSQYRMLSEQQKDELKLDVNWEGLLQKALSYPVTQQTRNRLCTVRQGRVYITDGIHEKFVSTKELQRYIEKGWKKVKHCNIDN